MACAALAASSSTRGSNRRPARAAAVRLPVLCGEAAGTGGQVQPSATDAGCAEQTGCCMAPLLLPSPPYAPASVECAEQVACLHQHACFGAVLLPHIAQRQTKPGQHSRQVGYEVLGAGRRRERIGAGHDAVAPRRPRPRRLRERALLEGNHRARRRGGGLCRLGHAREPGPCSTTRGSHPPRTAPGRAPATRAASSSNPAGCRCGQPSIALHLRGEWGGGPDVEADVKAACEEGASPRAQATPPNQHPACACFVCD